MSKFEEAFDLTGHGVFNHVVTFTSGLILMYTMMESLGIGYVMTVAECDLNLTPFQKGMINSAAFIGIMSTAVFWGYMSDLYGRRRVMLPATLASCAASFSSTLTTNFMSMFLMRFVTGCFVSASSATVFAYIGEMHTNDRRTTAIMWASTAIAFTFIFLPIFGWMILSGHWSFTLIFINIKPWRVFMWTWGIFGVAAAIILLYLPESPRYLLVMHGSDQACQVLARIYACNTGKKKEDYPVTTIVGQSEIATRRSFKVAMFNLGLLTRPPLRRCVVISHISMFMVFMISGGLYTWMPDMLNVMYDNINNKLSLCSAMVKYYSTKNLTNKLMLSESKPCFEKEVHFMVFPTSMIMGTLCSCAYIAIGIIVKKFSKVKFYCYMQGICSLMLAASAVVAYPKIAVALFVFGLCVGATASLLSAISVEIFPTSVRALALCTLYMFGRLGAAVGSNLLGMAMYRNCQIILLVMTLGNAASVLLLLLWPDPKLVRQEMEDLGFIY